MNSKVKNEFKLDKSHNWAIPVLIIGFILLIIAPIGFTLPTYWSSLDFSETGGIGDTIGGITAPIIGSVGAILLYLALRAQINANVLVQQQIQDQNLEKAQELETKQLYQFYNHLKDNIDNFTYEYGKIPFRLDELDPGQIIPKTKGNGAEAIYYFFNDVYCNPHDVTSDLETDPKLTELTSILEICKLLMEKLKESNSSEKDTIQTLTEHLFIYRISPRLRSQGIEALNRTFCDSCGHEHGLPKKFCDLIIAINEMVGNRSSN